jgi:hypothetical protein
MLKEFLKKHIDNHDYWRSNIFCIFGSLLEHLSKSFAMCLNTSLFIFFYRTKTGVGITSVDISTFGILLRD